MYNEINFRELVNAAVSSMNEEKEPDIEKMIADLEDAYGKSNEDQGKMVQLLRGLAFSDDPKANQFMKKLDRATTEIAAEMKAVKDESADLDEASVGDKHQKKIAIDTVKNPMKGVIAGGMSEKEAIRILKNKFGYSDSQIQKLQKEDVDLDEARGRGSHGAKNKREAQWYAAFKSAVTSSDKSQAGRIDWDTAKFLMGKGENPQDAAKKYLKAMKKMEETEKE